MTNASPASRSPSALMGSAGDAQPAPTRRRRWRALGRDDAGSPAIEFALAAPIFLLVAAAFVDFGIYMLVQVLIESSLRDAARYGITGQTPANGDRLAEMLGILERGTHGLVDVDQIELTIQAYPTFSDVGAGEDFVDGNSNGVYDLGETFKDCNGNGARDADRGTGGTGNSGDVVSYRIDYDWPMWTGMLTPLIGHAGKLHIQASTAVRNEPWDADSAGRTPRSCTL
ncbi:MAG TPA: TadE/TadG family type IV pilus assembly protein [Rhodospirillales bacterium]|nr:TadE/TadG family type IV pilus assembly protein [Rhodospirillales bacterium]